MKTIVIPDIHNETRWVAPFLKKHEPYDEVVFVGDYFDSLGDDPTIARGTAMWLKEMLRDKRNKMCMGNHDMPYLLPIWNPEYWCPGFTPEKLIAIETVMKREDWDKLVPAVFTQGWLISHAGFSAKLVAHPILGYPTGPEMVKNAEAGLIEAKNGNWNNYFAAGARMGNAWIGGITWLHWGANEHVPIVGVPQIVGHTTLGEPGELRVTKDQTDYNIDTHRRHAAIITDGKIEIVPTGFTGQQKFTIK